MEDPCRPRLAIGPRLGLCPDWPTAGRRCCLAMEQRPHRRPAGCGGPLSFQAPPQPLLPHGAGQALPRRERIRAQQQSLRSESAAAHGAPGGPGPPSLVRPPHLPAGHRRIGHARVYERLCADGGGHNPLDARPQRGQRPLRPLPPRLQLRYPDRALAGESPHRLQPV